MPIGIDWQGAIPASAVADASYQAGSGQYLQHQQAVALQQAQMAQQNQLAQQHLAAQMYAQQQQQLANQNSQVFHAQQQQAQNEFNKGFEYDRLQWQRDNSQQDWDRNRQAQLADQSSQRQWEVDKQPQVWGFQAATRSGEDLEKEINTGLTGFAKQRPYMTPEGVNALNELQSKFRAIQKVRDFARPQQYAQALGQFQADAARADIGQHINVPKTVQEQVEKDGGSFQQPIHAPDGTFMGYQVWTQTMRNGTPTLQPKFVPHRPDPLMAMHSAKTPDEYWNTLKPSEQAAMYGAVSKELAGESEEAPAPDKVMGAVRDRIAAMRGFKQPEKPGVPQDQLDQLSAVKQQYEQWKAANPQQAAAYEQRAQQVGFMLPGEHGARKSPGQPQQGGQQVQPTSTQGALTAGQQQEINRLAQQGQPLTPEQMAFQQQMAAHGQRQAQQAGQTFAAPSGGTALKAESLPAAARSQLPRLHSKEEVAAFRSQHGSGIPFEGPDGKVYQTN